MKSTEALKQFCAYFNFKVKGHQVKNYQNFLRQFFIFLHNPDIETIHLGQVIDYLQFSREFELDEATIYSRCLSMRAFFKFFRQQEIKVLDPELIPAKKPQPKFVDFVTEEEHQAILKAIKGNTPRAIRDTAMVKFLHDTGVRKGEMIALDMERISTEKMEAKIRTEKSKSSSPFRLVLWTEDTNDSLKKWLEVRDGMNDLKDFDPKAVFQTLWARHGGTRITESAIEEMLRKASVRANIRTIHAHLYRHAKGNGMAEDGENNSAIAKVLGHASMDSSRVYTDLNDQQTREVFARSFKR